MNIKTIEEWKFANNKFGKCVFYTKHTFPILFTHTPAITKCVRE